MNQCANLIFVFNQSGPIRRFQDRRRFPVPLLHLINLRQLPPIGAIIGPVIDHLNKQIGPLANHPLPKLNINRIQQFVIALFRLIQLRYRFFHRTTRCGIALQLIIGRRQKIPCIGINHFTIGFQITDIIFQQFDNLVEALLGRIKLRHVKANFPRPILRQSPQSDGPFIFAQSPCIIRRVKRCLCTAKQFINRCLFIGRHAITPLRQKLIQLGNPRRRIPILY